MISVVVTLCHLVTTGLNDRPILSCFEKVPFKLEMNINACGMTQSGIALWKEGGKYAGEEYVIGAFRCVPGEYEPAT